MKILISIFGFIFTGYFWIKQHIDARVFAIILDETNSTYIDVVRAWKAASETGTLTDDQKTKAFYMTLGMVEQHTSTLAWRIALALFPVSLKAGIEQAVTTLKQPAQVPASVQALFPDKGA